MLTKDIIKAGRERLGMTHQSFGDAVGVSRGAVQQWERGSTAPTRRHQPKVAALLGVSVAELMGLAEQGGESKITITGSEIDTGMVHIPHYDTGGSMGHGLVLRDQPGVIREWTVSDEWITKNIRVITSAKNLLVVTGFGDSMRPIFHPGDPVMVDTGVRTVDHDGIYFFRVEQEGFIKRLQRIPGEGLVAISENKAYRDWTIKPEMDFEVFGRVVKAWSGSDY